MATGERDGADSKLNDLGNAGFLSASVYIYIYIKTKNNQ